MCLRRTFGITNHLCDAIAVAQIQEDQAPVIAPSVYPTGQRHLLAHVCFCQFTACMGAIMDLKTHHFTTLFLLWNGADMLRFSRFSPVKTSSLALAMLGASELVSALMLAFGPAKTRTLSEN